jgi:hypothetical protein
MLMDCGWNVDENGVLATSGGHFVVTEQSALSIFLLFLMVLK